jgi:hypothetical protein
MIPNIDILTSYLSAQHQKTYLPLWLELMPKHILFNPGTENPAIYLVLQQVGIEVEEACHLVLLSTNQYKASHCG